jgi:hypothetical protein
VLHYAIGNGVFGSGNCFRGYAENLLNLAHCRKNLLQFLKSKGGRRKNLFASPQTLNEKWQLRSDAEDAKS